MVKAQTRSVIFGTYEFAQENGLGFNLTYLDEEGPPDCGAGFDTACMRRMYEYGYEKARAARIVGRFERASRVQKRKHRRYLGRLWRDLAELQMFTIISSAAGICALRRLHLHADGKANYGQGREERYCGFPEADCTYPIFYGVSLANLAGGNMQGSCNPPGPGQNLVGIFPPAGNSTSDQRLGSERPGPQRRGKFCPANFNQGSQLANCFSFACDSETYINGVPVATCHCPLGESFAGTQVSAHTRFSTQAGQGDQQFCFERPVSSMPLQP
jgi:hypothetical protein